MTKKRWFPACLLAALILVLLHASLKPGSDVELSELDLLYWHAASLGLQCDEQMRYSVAHHAQQHARGTAHEHDKAGEKDFLAGQQRDEIWLEQACLASLARQRIWQAAPNFKPNEAELINWAKDHQALWQSPVRYSFEQLYFRDQALAEEADPARAVVHPLGRMFTRLSLDEIEQRFGAAFAVAVGQAKLNDWQHGVQSPLGWHSLRLLKVWPAGAMEWAEAQPMLAAQWAREQQEKWYQRQLVALQKEWSSKAW